MSEISNSRRRCGKALVSVATAAAFWWLCTGLGVVNPLFLPSPLAVCQSVATLLRDAAIYQDMGATTYRALSGLFVSAVVAIPLGLFLGRKASIYEFIELPVDFLRSVPSSALFCLFILIFGIGDAGKIAVVFYGCSLILLVNSVYGARPTKEKQDRINMLRTFKATQAQIFCLAVVRDAVPHIAAGLRVCASLAFVLVVVTEMFLTARDGLGRRIYDSYLSYRVPEMYATIILLGLLGYTLNRLLVLIERRWCFWMPDARQD